MMKIRLCGWFAMFLATVTVQAGEPLVTLRVWNDQVPGEKNDIGVEKADTTAVECHGSYDCRL